MKDNKSSYLAKIIVAVIILFGIIYAARICGMDIRSMAVLEKIFVITMIILIALAVWTVYAAAIPHLVKRFDDPETANTPESVIPLINVIVMIVIACVAVFMIMSTIGVDLIIALTSAGLIGLAITFGAQSTLTQFFSGMSLLLAHPFKVGDIITLDGGDEKLEVLKIGIMNTRFREWDSSRIYSMPNNKLADSTIINYLATRNVYGMLIFVDIRFDADFDTAKEIMLRIANSSEHVIKDNPKYASEIEIEDFNSRTVTVKLTVFLDDFDCHDDVCSDIRHEIITEFKKAGVGLARLSHQDVAAKDNGPYNS